MALNKETEELKERIAWLEHEAIKTHAQMEWWMGYGGRFSRAALQYRLTNRQWKEVEALWCEIAAVCNSQKCAIFAWDCFQQDWEGPGIVDKTIMAWRTWLADKKAGRPQTEQFRHGFYMPAIPL